MSKVLDIINLEELLTKEVEISENKEDINPGILLIKSIEISKAVNNKMFLKGALTDGNIDIDFKIWDYNGDGSEFLNSIRVFKGKLNTYNGNIQLIINKYKFEDVDVKLLPLKFSMEYISGKTKELINIVKEPLYKELLTHFIIENEEFWEVPAATYNHHNYIGGLCQHSYEVGALAYMNAKLVEKTENAEINMDLVITGSLLHDIGKTKVYGINGIQPTYNEFYGLYEHLVLGVLMIREYLLNSNKYYGNEDKVALLDHIILAHHLKKEYGSPVSPQFKEAYIVNAADTFSSFFNIIEEASKMKIDGKNPKRINVLEGTTVFTNDFMKKLLYSGNEEFTTTLEKK